MDSPNIKSISHLTNLLRHNDIDPMIFLEQLETNMRRIDQDINAFLPEKRRFDRLNQEIASLNLKFPNPDLRPELFCLPIGVKDIFHINDHNTLAGAKIPPGRLTGEEAQSVTILKKLGALILGKTVTTEFAYFAPGPTRNPHNLDHTPGGSSSGSAAAVAAGLVPFAFGSQTIGSIIRPASFCGIVGFKPTYNRIPKDGVIPLSPSVDTIGYFSTDISNSRFMASFLCTGWQPRKMINSRPVLGIPDGPYIREAGDEMLDHFEGVCDWLKQSDYQIKKIGAMADFKDICRRHNVIVAKEAARIHQSWFSEFGDKYHPKTRELIKRGQGIDDEDYRDALQGRNKLREELTELMKLESIDLWLSPPAKGPAPLGLESTGDPVMNLPWTHCGFPSLNIPSGVNHQNLPMGLQVSAGWFQDEALLQWSEEIELSIHG